MQAYILPSFLALTLFTTPAWAYIDPATGTLLIQGLIAGFGAVMVFCRRHIRALWSKIRPNSETEDVNEKEPQSGDSEAGTGK